MNVITRWRRIAGLSLASTVFIIIVFYGHSKTSLRFNAHWDGVMELRNTANASEAVFVAQSKSVVPADCLNVTDIQQQRQLRMRQACEAMHLKQWSDRELKTAIRSSGVFYVDDRLRYIYCMVPKAACTTWTRVLLVASGQVKQKMPNSLSQGQARGLRFKGRILKPLGKFSPDEIVSRLKNYFKFMFVRHPLDRLSSAFYDRLKSNHRMPKLLYNQMIINRYGRNGTKSRRSGDVQFDEFVRYIVDPANKPSDFNFHWRPQFDLCLPCRINYDFVGHLETLQTDAHAVLTRLGPPASHVQFPTVDPDNVHGSHRVTATAVASAGHCTNWTARLKRKYASVSNNDIERLKTVVYANDMKVFGYD